MSRRLQYVLVGLSGLVLLLVAAALTLPYLFRDRLQALIAARVNAAIDADVRWSALELSFIRGFPHLGVTARDVRLCNRAPFEGLCLAEVEAVTARVAILPLLGGTIDVRSLDVRRPIVRVEARADGRANWQIGRSTPTVAPSGESEAPSRIRVAVRRYRIADARVTYVDRARDVESAVAALQHEGSGDISPAEIAFGTTTRADGVSLRVKGVPYLRDARLSAEARVGFDRVMHRTTLRDAELRVNDLTLTAEGTAARTAGAMALDVRWSSSATDLAGLVSLLPAAWVGNLQGLETGGAMAFDGRVQGTWTDQEVPALDARLSVRDGRFKYASLPAGADQISFEGRVTTPQAAGWDQLVVDVPHFTARLAGQPLDGRLRLATLSSDPAIDVAVRGRIDLADLPRLVPFSPGQTLTGHAEADVRLSGQLSALERPQGGRFAAEGYASLRDMAYRPVTSNRQARADALSLTFNPRHLQLLAEGAGIGETDVTIRGHFENYLPWWFGDGVLGGTFDVAGDAVDLGRLLRDEQAATPAPAADSPGRAASIPERIDLTIVAAARRVSYGPLELGGLRGRVRLRGSRAELHDLAFGLFGGTVTMNGWYDTGDPARPTVALSYAARGLDVQQAARLSSTLRAVAPVVVATVGTFDSTLDLTAALDPSLAIDVSSLAGRGGVTSSSLRIDQFAPLAALARALKIEPLEGTALGNVRFTFVLRDGRMIASPFDVRLGGLALRVGGSTGFAARDIDYDITGRVPTSVFGEQAGQRVAEWLGQDAAADGLPGLLGITARLTGTVAQPQVSLAVEAADVVRGAGAAALANARAEANRLLAEADAEAAAIRREADEAAARLKADADAAAERLVAEASNPLARAAARLAADRVRREAAARADQLVQAASARAEAVIEAARRRARDGSPAAGALTGSHHC